MSSKMAQDTLRCFKMAPKMLQEAPSPPQDGSKWPRSLPRRPPRGQNPSKTYGKSMIFAFSPFRFRWPSEASRWLQEGPRGPQEGPKRAPRRPQERPRAPQERSKRGPRGDFRGSRGATLIGSTLFFDRSPPRWPQERPQGSQERPKRAPRGAQEAPRGPQEAPKRLPRDPQGAPRGSPRHPRCSKRPPGPPRGPQDAGGPEQQVSPLPLAIRAQCFVAARLLGASNGPRAGGCTRRPRQVETKLSSMGEQVPH